MTESQQAAWNSLLNIQVFLAAFLILLVAVSLVEARLFLRQRPRIGALVGYGLLILAFILYKVSAFNEDAKLLFSSGLLGLAVSLIASIVLSDPPKMSERPVDPIDEAIARGFERFKERIALIKEARIAPRHKEMKLQSISEEFSEFLEAVKRIEARKE